MSSNFPSAGKDCISGHIIKRVWKTERKERTRKKREIRLRNISHRCSMADRIVIICASAEQSAKSYEQCVKSCLFLPTINIVSKSSE